MISGYKRSGWSTPRVALVAATDDAALAVATTMKYANIPTHRYAPDPRHKYLEIAFTQVTDNDSCSLYLYGARSGGDVTLAYTGTLVAGQQASTGGLGLYTNTISTVADTWITAVVLVDEGDNDQMARIVLDTHGYKYFFCLFTGLTGTEQVQAHYSGY